MLVAVTGASGFLGRYVVDELLRQGHEILVAGRHAPQSHPRITFCRTDLLQKDAEEWLRRHQPTHLLHLAWYAEHGKFWHSTLNLDWCDATVRLTEAFCKQGGKRLVVAGSCAEYDWSFGYCQETTTPTSPASLYGAAKHSAHTMTEQICRLNGVDLVWGRIFIPFGPGENLHRLVPSAINALLGRIRPFAINTMQWRDFLPVQLVAEALVFLLTANIDGAVNISSSIPIQLKELIENLGNFLNADPGILLESSAPPSDKPPRLLVGDNSKIMEAGWKTDMDLSHYFQEYAKILRTHTIQEL